MQLYVVLIAIVVFYFGWYRYMGWAQEGFNFINFIFLYFVGRYISKFNDLNAKPLLWIVCWLLFGSIMGLVSWYEKSVMQINTPWLLFMELYNSPFCIASAICLFMAFKTLRIKQNRVINWFAASALPIYLLHENDYIKALAIQYNNTCI